MLSNSIQQSVFKDRDTNLPPHKTTELSLGADASTNQLLLCNPSSAQPPTSTTPSCSDQPPTSIAVTNQDHTITPILISNEEPACLNQQPQQQHVGRGKKWQPEEDELLSQAWLRVSSETALQSTGDQRINDTFWNRVSDEYRRSCPGSNRPPRSIQQRWAKLHQCISHFGECYEEQENRLPAGTSTEAITVEALKQYKSKTEQNFPHYSCWTLLRHTRQWINHLNKPRMLPIKRKLNDDEVVNSNDVDSGICSSSSSSSGSYNLINEPVATHESKNPGNSSSTQKNTKLANPSSSSNTMNLSATVSSSSSLITITPNKKKKIELMERKIKLIEELNQSMIKKNKILEEFNRLEKETNQIKIMAQFPSNESQLWFKFKQQEILNEFNLKILH